jgi:hypothetical protein
MRRAGAFVVATLGVLAVLGLAPATARAAQKAVVEIDGAEVHQFANASSPVLGTLKVDATITVSTDMIRDVRGEYWYKTKLDSGDFGYVRAKELVTSRLEREMRDFGVDMSRPTSVADTTSPPWTFVIRAMGLGGANTTNGFEAGGEGEATFCALFWEHGYLHRMFSLGGVYSVFPNDTIIAGSVVLRLYSESVSEPELRFRFGDSTKTSQLVGGVNAGWNYPFVMGPSMQLSLYLEAGSYFGFTTGYTHLWASLGLGIHF